MKVGICMKRLEDLSKDELLKIMFEELRKNPPKEESVVKLPHYCILNRAS